MEEEIEKIYSKEGIKEIEEEYSEDIEELGTFMEMFNFYNFIANKENDIELITFLGTLKEELNSYNTVLLFCEIMLEEETPDYDLFNRILEKETDRINKNHRILESFHF
jgi:hypothetical protein